jgi:SAM-dependent methyltransferase
VVAHGIVAPFIAELVGREPAPSSLRRCEPCDLVFFDHRYDDDEMSAIYSGYRNDDYRRIRTRWEPWYRRSVNEAFLGESAAVADRRHFVEAILRDAGLADEDFGMIVDVGGDEGQFFPAVRSDERVVIDVSNKALPPDVTRVASLQGLGRDAGLLIIAHVLEHLPDPLGMVREAIDVLAPGGFLYVEVPLDRPRIRPSHSTPRHARWTRWVSRSRAAFTAADFATGVSRQQGWRVPRLGLVKESEHINYFSTASLERLLRSAGLHVLAQRSEPNATGGGLRLGRLGMVAERLEGDCRREGEE